MTSRQPRSRTALAVATALGASLAGCGGPGPEAALDAAVVPDADVLVRVEIGPLRQAAVFAGLRGADAPATPDAAVPTAEAEIDGERLLALAGLAPDDVVTLVLSADLDPLDVEPGAEAPDLAAVPSAAALLLARPLGLDRLEQAIIGAASGAPAPPSTVTRLQIGSVPALRLQTAGEEPAEAFLAVVAGDAVLLAAPSRESLAGALDRAASGAPAPVAPALERLLAALPAGTQARVGFVVPRKFRDGLKARLEEPPPELAMFAGFVAPFEELQSLSLGVRAADDLTVVLGGDLGAEQPAQQASAILGGLLGPMAKSALASAVGREAAEMDDRLAVAATGPNLEVTLRLTAGDLEALRAGAEEAPAEAAEEAALDPPPAR